MKVLVLGGDGFCGWPCAVNLADQNHDVVIVDNLSRRKIDIDLEVESLTPIVSIGERLNVWESIGGKPMRFIHMDIAHEYQRLLDLIIEEKPDSVVHFAEQRAAPYSMKSSATKRYTVDNNVNGTHNLLAAIVESGQDIHVVHLGTMGCMAMAPTVAPPFLRATSRWKCPSLMAAVLKRKFFIQPVLAASIT